VLGVSQSIVSRLKTELITYGFIKHISAIPNFVKLGFEIMPFSCVKFNMNEVKKIEGMAKDWAKSCSEIIFAARSEGMGMKAVTVSLHKDHASYKEFFAENRKN